LEKSIPNAIKSYHYHVTVTLLSRYCHITNTLLSCYSHVAVMLLLHYCHVTVMLLTLSFLCIGTYKTSQFESITNC